MLPGTAGIGTSTPALTVGVHNSKAAAANGPATNEIRIEFGPWTPSDSTAWGYLGLRREQALDRFQITGFFKNVEHCPF
jgi:hypothetical protein